MARFLWIQKQNMGPLPRAGHAAVFDEKLQRVIAFGGEAEGRLLDDTWAWDGRLWTQVADTGPAPRSGAAMAHLLGAGLTLLFGGRAGDALLGDTWQWAEDGWVQVEDTGPPPRAGHAVAHDTARSRLVLFGGRSPAGCAADTWEWDGTNWAQLDNSGPPARSGHAMCYDRDDGKVVMFGGAGDDGAPLSDTWAWDGSSWTQVADMGPAARHGAAMANTGDGTILFGGVTPTVGDTDAAGRIFADTWAWRDGRWTQVQDIGPAGRWDHCLVFDGMTGKLTLFGGRSGRASSDSGTAPQLFGDTWEHAGNPFPLETPSVSDATVVPPGARLINPGDWLTIEFTAGPVPNSGLQVSVLGFTTPSLPPGALPVDVPGLTLAGSANLDPGPSSRGQFMVIRGSEPLESGMYGAFIVADPYTWGSAREAIAMFEVGEG